MKLIATIDEITKYSKLGILKIKDKDEYFINSQDLKGVNHQINIEIGEQTALKESNKILEYNKYWEAFPTPSEIKKYLTGIKADYARNLRTGSRDTIQKRLVKLSKLYSPSDILDTIKYDISLRLKQSLETNKNMFEYMKGAEPWCNDEANISVLFAEMKGLNGKSINKPSSLFNDEFTFV